MRRHIRWRYLALNIMCDQPLDKQDLINAVWAAVYQLFGDYGASQVNLRLIEYDPMRKYFIIRCSHKALDKVRASIASITEIKEKIAALHVMVVSGTIKSLHKTIESSIRNE